MSFKPYVKIIPPGEATGELKRVYDKIKQTRGMIAPVQTVFSLRPDIMEKMSELGAIAHFQDGFLSRRQHELIATYASALNSCAYWTGSHSNFLRSQGADEQVNLALRNGNPDP